VGGHRDAGTDSAVEMTIPSTSTGEKILRIAVPAGMLVLAIVAWHLFVTINEVPHYILPSPADVAGSLYSDWGTLYPALLVTLRITFTALFLALVGGVLLA